MGIFTRARDIISANVNAMLDCAEDPEKLVNTMIREMEDTLIEVKASCAGAMAAKRAIETDSRESQQRAAEWEARAQIAVSKGRDDLARDALKEKRRYTDHGAGLEKEQAECEAVIAQYQTDIRELEDKLDAVREKRRVLVQRHVHALHRRRAQQDIRRVDTSHIFSHFDAMQYRLDVLESEAAIDHALRAPSLRDEIDALVVDEAIERELQSLKASRSGH
ncbi:MAG: hypothetical protein AMXMBFR84_04940 [Candidatus Hydrogenedentota bacterium]